MEEVDLIASGYEWECPDCEKTNRLIEVPKGKTVKCKWRWESEKYI